MPRQIAMPAMTSTAVSAMPGSSRNGACLRPGGRHLRVNLFGVGTNAEQIGNGHFARHNKRGPERGDADGRQCGAERNVPEHLPRRGIQ